MLPCSRASGASSAEAARLRLLRRTHLRPLCLATLLATPILFSPRTLAVWLREGLETYPEKILFGTDGYPLSSAMGWEEATSIASHNARWPSDWP